MSGQSLSDTLFKWIGLLAAIAGGAVALYEFSDANRKRVDERELQSLAYATAFSSRDYFPIRRAIYRAYIHCDVDCGDARLDNSAYFAFVEFFDIVYACVEAGTCDEGLARDFFTPYANGHWHCMRKVIEGTRAMEQGATARISFGSGLEFFNTRETSSVACRGHQAR